MLYRQIVLKKGMPFDAMKGLKEALRDREKRHTRTEKSKLAEDSKERNGKILQRLDRGMKVTILCHHAFHEVTKEGWIAEINYHAGYLMLGNLKIYFDDVYEIRIQD